MRRRLSKALVALPCMVLVGCASAGIDPDALEGVAAPVLDRHDEYVAQDGTLSDFEQSIYLRSTELVRKLIEEGKAANGDF